MFRIAENKDFLSAIGADDISELQLKELVAELENLAQERLMLKIKNSLTDLQMNEFDSIDDEGDAYLWVVRNLPTAPSLMPEILEDIKKDILEHNVKISALGLA